MHRIFFEGKQTGKSIILLLLTVLHPVHEVLPPHRGDGGRARRLQEGQGGPPHDPPRLRRSRTHGVLLHKGQEGRRERVRARVQEVQAREYIPSERLFFSW